MAQPIIGYCPIHGGRRWYSRILLGHRYCDAGGCGRQLRMDPLGPHAFRTMHRLGCPEPLCAECEKTLEAGEHTFTKESTD